MSELKRCNLEETDRGIKMCRGNHEKHENCQWEYFVSADEIERLTKQRDELLEALKEAMYSNSTELAQRLAKQAVTNAEGKGANAEGKTMYFEPRGEWKK